MADQLSNDLASLRIDSAAKRAPRRKRWIGVVVALAVVAGAAAVATPHLEASFFRTEVSVTEVSSVSPATVSTQVTASGYVVPQILSKVGSKAQGKIARVAVTEGQVVAEGDLLIALDDADQRSSLQAAEARVAQARADAQRLRVQLGDIERRLKRERTLAAEGVTGRAQSEDMEAELGGIQQSVSAATANALAAEAEVRMRRSTLDDLTIRAPIRGTVLTKPPEVGEVVSMASGPILEIADFESLQVEAEVPESRLSKVKIGGACEIMLDAYPSRRYRGVVQKISPTVNRAKATVVVKVGFVGEADGVLPNMAARAYVLEDDGSADQIGQPPKTVVPRSAVVDRGGMKMVFAIEGDRVRMTRVSLGPEFAHGYELVEGPRVGTRLVQDPPTALTDGQRIHERNAP